MTSIHILNKVCKSLALNTFIPVIKNSLIIILFVCVLITLSIIYCVLAYRIYKAIVNKNL